MAIRVEATSYTKIMILLDQIKKLKRGIVIVDIELSRGINITFKSDAIVRCLNVDKKPMGLIMSCQMAGRASRSGSVSCSFEYILANASTKNQEACYDYQLTHNNE